MSVGGSSTTSDAATTAARRPRRWPWVLGAVVLVVGVLAVGAVVTSRPRAVETDDGTVLVLGHDWRDEILGSDVAGTGTGGVLTVTESGCLVLGTDPDAPAVVWPPGTDVDTDDGRLVIEAGGHRYSPGDQVTGGGDAQSSARLTEEFGEAAAPCLPRDAVRFYPE